uniref:Uncharacterized protein n=1 Tax=Oryza brachyantha TaxID=4533 RepID=J3MVP3_ORYBR
MAAGGSASGSSNRMVDMMARLHLTASEAKAVVLEDEKEVDLVDPSWVLVGKHAVLLQKYDGNFKPLQVPFDRMAIWAKIIDWPCRLMNARRGGEIAKALGRVMKVETNDQGWCWGGFMRVRVDLTVEEPIPCFVTVYSSRDKTFKGMR